MAGKAKIAIEQLSWNNAKPAPIVLVSGAEGFLADRATQRIREILRDADASLEVSDVDASHGVGVFEVGDHSPNGHAQRSGACKARRRW